MYHPLLSHAHRAVFWYPSVAVLGLCPNKQLGPSKFDEISEFTPLRA
jgi:hypothetical protein